MKVNRILSKEIKTSIKRYPVVSITGPRQSGKTTLARLCFPDYAYFNLEDVQLREAIENDPGGFLKDNPGKMIIDEVQKYPDLLSYIQVRVDDSNKMGQFVITGSENLLLSEKVSQSLAGRVSIFNLLPFSIGELKKANLLKKDAFSQLWRGFYPRMYDRKIPPGEFYANYLATYLERDVRQIKNVGSLSLFQRFLQLLAGRTGQLLNLSFLANDVGVDVKTIDSWLSVLEVSFIAFRINPYFKNFNKRLIKSPKVYFYDTGLVAHLLGIDSLKEMKTHYARGALFENFVIAEIMKTKFNKRLSVKPYFWRDSNGNEIDLLLDEGSCLKLVEIKAGISFKTDFARGLGYWDSLDTKVPVKKFVVYAGERGQTIKDYQLLPWMKLEETLDVLI